MESMENYNLNTNKFDGSAKSIDDIFAEESNDNDDDDDVHCSESEDFSENEDFYFESDHLALRGNQDYRAVLRTIVILESQRIEVAKHIDKLADIKRKATQDPNGFVEKLSSQNLDIPGPINIQNLPKIKLEKYNVSLPSIWTGSNTGKAKDENDFTVRGRAFDQTKPVTFNQLWTCEEQRRLEELLVEYPPEPIEMRRFAKIAKALGNRTPRQVASRLQKYFQKLHAAGLPVPGRVPRNARSYVSSRKHRIFKHMTRPTTFFPSNYVPINIMDDNDSKTNLLDPNYYRNGWSTGIENELDMMVVDEPIEIENDVHANKSAKIAAIIKRVMEDKQREYSDELSISEHNGYKCDYCGEDPIFGTRWHCITCQDRSIDFCSDCFVTQAQEENHHSLQHIFIGYRVSADFRAQSDTESDENDQNEQTQEDNINENDMQYFDPQNSISYDHFCNHHQIT